MVKGIEKIIRHFIDGKEYSPGLIVEIVSVEQDRYDNIKVIFDLKNEGDVPYNLLIVGVNLREEIMKYSEYISFEPNDIIVSYVKQPNEMDIFYVYGSIPFNQIFHITKSFKFEMLHNLQDVTKLHLNHYNGSPKELDVIGKFLPRITVRQFRDELILELTFKVSGTNPKVDYDLQQLESDVDVALLDGFDEEYRGLSDSLDVTFNRWSRNFFLDNIDSRLPSWLIENFRLGISLV